MTVGGMSDTFANIEAERAVLGMMLAGGARVLSALQATDLQAGHFYRDTHRRLWELLVDRWEAGQPVDTMAVVVWLAERPEAEQTRVGGLPYLSSLADHIPSTENVAYYAGRVIETATRRQVRTDAQQLLERVAQGAEVTELLDLANRQLTRLGTAGEDAWQSLHDAAEAHWTGMEARAAAQSEGDVLGIPWGIPELDEVLPAMEPGWLVIIAGRPAMGKSSFALEVLRQAARRGEGAAINSLEMTANQLTRKLIALEANCPTAVLRDGVLTGGWAKPVREAHEAAARWNAYIDDTAGLSIEEIQGRLRRLSARMQRSGKAELGIAFVDYAQLVRSRGENENIRLGETTRRLKETAKELGIVVVALAQVNRACESRQDKRPLMSDLRGSGQMEQDADAIAFLYRHHVYDPAWPADEAEVIFRKFREAQPQTLHVHWDGTTQRFGRPLLADNVIPVPVPAPTNPYAEPRR